MSENLTALYAYFESHHVVKSMVCLTYYLTSVSAAIMSSKRTNLNCNFEVEFVDSFCQRWKFETNPQFYEL